MKASFVVKLNLNYFKNLILLLIVYVQNNYMKLCDPFLE